MIISHTHWDRQWYRTAQEFRLELVKMIDSLIDLLLHNPDYRVFHLDGQTAIIEDYLALRPERVSTIIDLVEAGKLKIGPWYVQPDAFLASGEAMIRNLLKGTSDAKKLGGCTLVGWLPDPFGHPAQLPQIFANFGIESFVFARGLGDQLEKEAYEFIWESPHQDKVLAIHQRKGYYSGGNLAYPSFWGDIHRYQADHDSAVKRLTELIQENETCTCSHIIPIWNGSDHAYPEYSLPETIRYANRTMLSSAVRHASIEEYIKLVQERACNLQTVQAELRDARYEPILASVLSSRMWVKQINYRLERELERETEPLLILADLWGHPYPSYAVADAWTSLLQNHFHDAIGGCSKDEVYTEVHANFAKTEQTICVLRNDAIDAIVFSLTAGKSGRGETALVFFNAIPQTWNTVAMGYIDLPYWEGEALVEFTGGKKVPLQIQKQETITDEWLPHQASVKRIRKEIHWWQQTLRSISKRCIADFSIHSFKGKSILDLKCANPIEEPDGLIDTIIKELERFPENTVLEIHASLIRLHILIPTLLPAYGYTTAFLRQKRSSDELSYTGITADEGVLENRFIRVSVHENGNIDIFYKERGILYTDIHRFQDQADRGDTYDFCPISEEDEHNTLLQPHQVRRVLREKGPVRGCIGLYQTFTVPLELDGHDRDKRSEEKHTLLIESDVYVSWETPFVEFKTTVHNTVKDHRLRLYTHSSLVSDAVYSDGQFCIQKREVRAKEKPHWAFAPASVYPHDRWVALSDGEKGLAVFSEGLPEHAVIPAPDGCSIALTLLRCVGWLSRQDIASRPGHAGPSIPTPGAQCQGDHLFRYAVYPFCGTVEESDIVHTAQQFDARALVQQARLSRLSSYSLFALTPQYLQVTAIKKSEDGHSICFRLYNPKRTSVVAHLRGALRVHSVWRSRADEQPLQQLSHPASSLLDLTFTVEVAEIVTLLLEPDVLS